MEDQEVDSGANATINARTVNVEEVHLEALNLGNGGWFSSKDTVRVDAGRMDSVEEFWSDNSSAHLNISDVRLGSKLSITKDITFGLRDTDFATDFTALFDSQSLKAAPDTTLNSQLLVRIADVSTQTPLTPLANVNLNLSFVLGEETVDLVNIQSTDGTYPGLQAALQAALEEAGYGSVQVELSAPYNQVTVGTNTVTLPFTAQEILLTDPAGNEFSNVDFTYSAIEPVPDGFLVAGNAAPVDPSEVSHVIESNLVLDNAGRSSLAGDVVIGGMSNSNGGIQKFNVTVDRDSKIEGLYTTNNRLESIEIDSTGANGDLWIGGTQGGLLEIDANAFAGENLSLGQGELGYGGWTDAIFNLRNLNAGGTEANVTFNAVYNGNGLASNAQAFVANTGAGNDVIYAENTGAKTTTLLVAGGEFDDVAFTSSFGTEVDYAELLYGREVQVTLGLPGMDSAEDFAEGLEATFRIDASNGFLTTERDLYQAAANAINEDPVLSKIAVASVDSNGHLAVRYLVDGATEMGDELVKIEVLGDWEDLNATQRANIITALKTNYKDSTIDDAYVESAYDAVNGLEDFAEVQASGLIVGEAAVFTVDLNGLVATSGGAELTFKIDGAEAVLKEGDDFTGATDEAGIAAALAGESVMTGGVTYTIAQVGTTEITLTATTNGAVAGDVTIDSDEGGPVTVTGTQTTEGVDDIALGFGTDSLTNGGTNVVNGGLDDDVIVLSSDDATTDTVVFDAGGFGNDTIVHFTAGSAGDVLDFTAWLDNEFSHSGSPESRARVDTELNNGPSAVNANDVTVVNFNELAFAGTVNFDGMTNANVLTALNDTGGFTVAAPTGPNFVGNVQNSLLLVHNYNGTPAESNEGEYAVFQVTSGLTGDFTGVTLVGTLDFGEAQVFDVANFA